MGYRSKWQLLVVGSPDQLSEFQDFVETQSGDARAPHNTELEDRFQYFIDSWDEEPITLATSFVGFRYAAEWDKCYSPVWEDFRDMLYEYLEDHGIQYSMVRVGEDATDIEEAYSDRFAYRAFPELVISNPFEGEVL